MFPVNITGHYFFIRELYRYIAYISDIAVHATSNCNPVMNWIMPPKRDIILLIAETLYTDRPKDTLDDGRRLFFGRQLTVHHLNLSYLFTLVVLVLRK